MQELLSFFQAFSGITKISDKVTVLLILIVTLYFVDQRLLLTENYRKTEIYARQNSLYPFFKTSEAGKSVLEDSLVKNVIKKEILQLDRLRSQVQETKTRDQGRGVSPSLFLDIITSGFWFILYFIGSIIFILVQYTMAARTAKVSGKENSLTAGVAFWLSLGLFVVLGSFAYISYQICMTLPIIFHQTINYVLNIAICSYLLNAVTSVLASFFIEKEHDKDKESKDSGKPDVVEKPIVHGFLGKLKMAWNRFVQYFQFSEKSA